MNSAAHTGVVGRVRRAARSDEALLARAQQGDSACFDEIYRRYEAAVFGYCLVRLSDRQAAEDATQEVFLKAHSSASEPIGNARAWLFTVARNVVIDASRRRRATPVQVELEAAIDRAAIPADESDFSAMDVASNVFIALRRLPARQRRAMVLRDFQDRSSQQIAKELEMRPGSVDVLICRARAAFGKAYTEVSEMPFACRQTTEAIYRESGSGITERQRQFVDTHVASCPRCASEYSWAHSPGMLAGLLPWLWLRLDTMGLADTVNRLRAASAPVVASVERLPTAGMSTTAKATLGVAITAAILVPGVATNVADSPTAEPKTFRSALADQESRPTTRQMLEPRPGGQTASAASGTGHDIGMAGEFERLDIMAHPKAMAEEQYGSPTYDTGHPVGSSQRSDGTVHTITSTHIESTTVGMPNETHPSTITDTHVTADQFHE